MVMGPVGRVITWLPTCCAVMVTAYVPAGVVSTEAGLRFTVEQAVRLPASAPLRIVKQSINSRRPFCPTLRRKKRPIIPNPNIAANVIGAAWEFWLVVVVPTGTLVLIVTFTSPGKQSSAATVVPEHGICTELGALGWLGLTVVG